MEIYIESFLIQNILINFCLLRLVYLTTKNKSGVFRLILASIIGASFSVLASIILKHALILNIIKIICAISMLVIAFKQTKKQFIFNLILLFIYTYAMGGAITSLSSANYLTSFGAVMMSKFSLELITISIILLTYIFELVVKHIGIKIKTKNFIYTLILKSNKRQISINAYLDTGNLLSYNGEPVIIMDLDVYLKFCKKNIVEFYLEPCKTISLSTVAGRNELKLFTIPEIEIRQGRDKKVLHNQYIAVNSHDTFKKTNYQALLTPALI